MKTVLFSEEQIKKRVAEMAQEISKHYAGKQVLAVGLLNGAFMFVADVLCNDSLWVDFMAVSSYGRWQTWFEFGLIGFELALSWLWDG